MYEYCRVLGSGFRVEGLRSGFGVFESVEAGCRVYRI
jgi:hypothetical protein